MLDDLDRRILRRLQNAPDISVADLAEMSVSTPAVVSRRLSKLREEGIIIGKEAVIDWQKLGYDIEVSLRITLDKTQNRAFEEFLEAARLIPQVIELQTFVGRVDVRLSVIAKDMADYQRVYRDLILKLPHMSDVEALLHISRIKSDEVLPV
ncbi:MAG: Lrp/AsnC family transcriptional regulator [Paracoccaceae bacterium]